MHRRALAAALLGGALIGSAPAPAAAEPDDPSFRVVNRTSMAVRQLYASPSTQPTWGREQLGGDAIQPGADRVVRPPADGTCIYDIRLEYEDGRSEERRGTDTCSLADVVVGGGGGGAPPAAPSGPRANPSFYLVNQSGRVIEQFYASPSSQQSWGPDRLGDELVPPGGRYPISLPLGECQYDLRVVWRGGDAQERRNLDACGMNDYVVR